jgi:DUF4097 and DUF4098 domain-containing protein YvlB
MMTENKFISELETAISRLPEDERNDILIDIREYFSNGRGDGKTDDEIAASLGSPAKIAAELLDSYPFVENETPAEVSDELITITDNSYTNVDIDVQHGALFVRPSHDTTTTVELIGSNEKLELTAQVVGDTLVVRLKSLRHWLFMFNFNMKAVTLNVFIPKKLYQSFAMKTDNGRIDATKILGNNVTANTDNGRIQLKEIAATSLTAETDNGRIVLEKAQVDHVRTKTDNGRIEMSHVDADSIGAESDNGRIVLEHVKGSVVGITDNGRIILQTESLDRNIDLKTDNGSILVESTMEPTNVSIHAKTGHGRVDIFGERNSRTVIGAGENTIRLKSDNGRITVK